MIDISLTHIFIYFKSLYAFTLYSKATLIGSIQIAQASAPQKEESGVEKRNFQV